MATMVFPSSVVACGAPAVLELNGLRAEALRFVNVRSMVKAVLPKSVAGKGASVARCDYIRSSTNLSCNIAQHKSGKNPEFAASRGGTWQHGATRAVSSDYVGDVEEPSSSSSSGGSAACEVESAENSEVSATFPEKIALFQDAFWRFLRPHTIRGTLLGSTALVSRALIENPNLVNWVLLPKALRGVLALLCGNGYIVGINQIYDVKIDKINKPFLPIAAGDLSVPVAWGLVLGLATLGVGIASTDFGPLITALYSFGLLLGTIYST